ncbi:efflux RND transporter periplasmic adaptor subunit [Salinicola rhizosphaerae]|uniref:Resistance-nodulation-cell division (RND) efflux membrane fusion protein n=1 Tax=Salinicola rhizosphaerae TaxID=1443141 RepID=A0ABQ3EBA2_9GAMM|nr:efflux RND transporter periplasmic adaptor subunit [Salinicola rhizosphaerae]GHB26943.1 resistance-nodulation-cell division (RND) efflux membrane fusion protein [Salinicola rhizosphaerae]
MPSPSTRQRHPLRWILIIVLIVIAGVVAYRYLAAGDDSKAGDGTPQGGPGMGGQTTAVSAVAASEGDLPIELTALGTVRPLQSVEVRPRVEGELLEVNFDEGDSVRKGQQLARIDPRDYQAQLDEAKGQLAQDQAQLASAQQDLARYQKLIKTNYVSQQDLDQQRQLVRQYQGTVASDKASVQSAQVQLDYTDIKAPITGVVGIRNVDPGNIVQLGDDDPIVTITQLDPISVIFSLPSRYVDIVRQRLTAGDHPSVSVTGTNGKTFSGTLTSIDSNINSATGTIRLRATLDNPDGGLYPNAYVDVSLVSQILEDQVIVPEPAVQTGQSGDYVYVVNDDGTVSRRDVTLVATQNSQSALSAGVKAGEQVVVDGVDSLSDGAKVRIVSDALPGESSDEADDPASAASGDSSDGNTNGNAASGSQS